MDTKISFECAKEKGSRPGAPWETLLLAVGAASGAIAAGTIYVAALTNTVARYVISSFAIAYRADFPVIAIAAAGGSAGRSGNRCSGCWLCRGRRGGLRYRRPGRSGGRGAGGFPDDLPVHNVTIRTDVIIRNQNGRIVAEADVARHLTKRKPPRARFPSGESLMYPEAITDRRRGTPASIIPRTREKVKLRMEIITCRSVYRKSNPHTLTPARKYLHNLQRNVFLVIAERHGDAGKIGLAFRHLIAGDFERGNVTV